MQPRGNVIRHETEIRGNTLHAIIELSNNIGPVSGLDTQIGHIKRVHEDHMALRRKHRDNGHSCHKSWCCTGRDCGRFAAHNVPAYPAPAGARSLAAGHRSRTLPCPLAYSTSVAGSIAQVKPARHPHTAIIIVEIRQHPRNMLADKIVIIGKRQPVHGLWSQRGIGHARDNGNFGAKERRSGLVDATRPVHHAHRILHRHDLRHAFGIEVYFSAAQTWQDERIPPRHQM